MYTRTHTPQVAVEWIQLMGSSYAVYLWIAQTYRRGVGLSWVWHRTANACALALVLPAIFRCVKFGFSVKHFACSVSVLVDCLTLPALLLMGSPHELDDLDLHLVEKWAYMSWLTLAYLR